mmetsp:Transcript_22884/g.63975  ORF Transcript_22884/g.63975 Transcript_22884/m.63975 type:complete len:217 (-) Transcript_22884:688-1338(-)
MPGHGSAFGKPHAAVRRLRFGDPLVCIQATLCTAGRSLQRCQSHVSARRRGPLIMHVLRRLLGRRPHLIENVVRECLVDLAYHSVGAQRIHPPEVADALLDFVQRERGQDPHVLEEPSDGHAAAHGLDPLVHQEVDGGPRRHELPPEDGHDDLSLVSAVAALVVVDREELDWGTVVRRDEPLDVAIGCEQHTLQGAETLGQLHACFVHRYDVAEVR